MNMALPAVMGVMIMIIVAYRFCVSGTVEFNGACLIDLIISVQCACEWCEQEATGNEE